MATSGELADTISKVLSIPLGTVQFYGQALRSGGLISKSGRGRSSAEMTSLDAARWLVAVFTGKSAPSAVAELPWFETSVPLFIGKGRSLDIALWNARYQESGGEPTGEVIAVPADCPLVQTFAAIIDAWRSCDFKPGERTQYATFDFDENTGSVTLDAVTPQGDVQLFFAGNRPRIPSKFPKALVTVRRLHFEAFWFVADTLDGVGR